MAFRETTKVDEPTFYGWWSHVLREWEPPEEVRSFISLTGFAFALASFSSHNNPVQVDYGLLSKRAHIGQRQARRLLQQALQVGLFVKTGPAREGKTPVLRRALPGVESVKSDIGGVTDLSSQIDKFDTEIVRFDNPDGEKCTSAEEDQPRSGQVPGDKFVIDDTGNNRVDIQSMSNSGAETRADELRRLVRCAPDSNALEALWKYNRHEWTPELTELAAARRSELGSVAA